MRTRKYSSLIFLAGVGLAVTGACVDPDSPLIEETAEGCDEFQPGSDMAGLDLQPRAGDFVQAAADFTGATDAIARAVADACAGIAVDLGSESTWDGFADLDDVISNGDGTGACDQAGKRIEEMLLEAETVDAHVALSVSRGECYPDFEAQAACEADCVANAQCTPGTVETRCEPGELSVLCDGACSAEAECIGKVELAANCMGRCESECVGHCDGICFGENGTVTENDPNCVGKCSATCNGTCKGRCKVRATEGVQCGANVRCTGGCTGSFSDPVCTSTFHPPECAVDPSCYAACEARVMAEAPCDPTQVRIFADVVSMPDLDPLVRTLEANLPPLIDAAEKHGRLVMNSADRLGDAGESLDDNVDELDGKSIACVTEASSAIGDSVGVLDVSVEASVDVTVRAQERMQ